MSVPMFDSLTHPLLRGTWDGLEASFDILAAQLDAANVVRACAVGMPSIGGYSHEEFAARCARDPRLVPVAGFDPADLSARPGLVADLVAMGFKGMKVHPRLLNMSLTDVRLSALLAQLEQAGLPLFLCTYAHDALLSWPDADPFAALVALLRPFPALKTVLVHGGDVSVLRFAELVRHNDNLLLDLSFTLCKYAGSSVDLDLAFLFRSFDRRICVGSDFPEFSLTELRERFDHFSTGLAQEQVENIASGNLSRWLELER